MLCLLCRHQVLDARRQGGQVNEPLLDVGVGGVVLGMFQGHSEAVQFIG